MQMWNDQQNLKNGDSMKKMMKATRAEARLARNMAKNSQKMAEDMRKDSVSMKTVSLCLLRDYEQWDTSNSR